MQINKYVRVTIIIFLVLSGSLLFLYVKALEKRNFNSKIYKLGVTFFNFNTLEMMGSEDLIKHFRLECKDEGIDKKQVLVKDGKILSRPKSFKGSTVLYAYYNESLLGHVYIPKIQDWWSFDYKFKLYEENDSVRCYFWVIGPKEDFLFHSTPYPNK